MSTEPTTLRRPCWFDDGTPDEPEWRPGTLHTWGTDSESDNAGVWHIPVGIIEDESGRMHSVYVNLISLAAESPAGPTA